MSNDDFSPAPPLPAPSVGADSPANAERLAGTALALSGGGYRAMLFHLGALWRLNEAGYLPDVDRVSSVSGGSLTAGVLALHWSRLAFGADGTASNFVDLVVGPLRRLAGHTLDARAILSGVLLPGSVGDRVARAYDKHLFGGATLQDLPDDTDGTAPRFVINATNLQSGVLWRFSRPYMGDYRIGLVRSPTLSLARAVAASSAFPPFLSPVTLKLDPEAFDPATGTDLTAGVYRKHVVLSDGGVYDNLGLEPVWKRHRTVFVSDGGGRFDPEPRPKRDWARHAVRVLGVIDNQVRSLRKRQTIAAYVRGARDGVYWGIRTDIAAYGLADPLPAPHARTLALADTRTRLKRLDAALQERLINWGYAVCDTALRTHIDRSLPRGAFPYPDASI